ncbi:methyltransferase FkbM [Rhizoclosmatium globosum]|uniref:Methyltransferase FkbM n=1 Tax=Rhizoclosmatium globosum TaxID=329046 RepID=A0A1Y2CUY6_9FUNG|nr:hypothetical protein HDU79_005512 [Rhizoclosmatium sp. JEL0117]ORY50822.1 methyltransferase FkbM [Rhizoclosmatium globosum]|eukprot:ORY50822.1 methyltransferase FkbM [Rhizoclosmatium globosum]
MILRNTRLPVILAVSVLVNILFALQYLASHPINFPVAASKKKPWSPALFDQCCKEDQSVLIKDQSPAFSFCLYPQGKDRHVADSVYRGAGTSDGIFEAAIRQEMLSALEELNDPNAVVLDIGGNIGLHTMFLANAGYKVHAFEPMLSNYQLLSCSATSNSRLYNNVVANNYGLGRKAEKTCIVADKDNFGAAKIKVGQTCSPENTVEVRRLDQYLIKNKLKPALVKVDTEGYEFKALEPAKEYFRKYPPAHIFSEFCPRHFRDVGDDAAKFLEFFWDLGYKIEVGQFKDVQKGDEAYEKLFKDDLSDIHMYRD